MTMDKNCQTCDRTGTDKECKDCMFMRFVESYPHWMRKKFKDRYRHEIDYDALMLGKQMTIDEMEDAR